MYLFITGENPVKSASGLGLIVIAIGILIPLQYNVFMTGECLFYSLIVAVSLKKQPILR